VDMVKCFSTKQLYHKPGEELFYFVAKNIPHLCGVWRFANAY